MSAPHTDVEKQAKQHKAPLLGIGGSMLWAVLAAIVIAVFLFMFSGDQEDVNPVELEETAPVGDIGEAVDTSEAPAGN